MNNQEIIEEIVNSLGEKKDVFLQDVAYEINKYISRQSPSSCLSLVTRNTDNSISAYWTPSPSRIISYTKVFLAFVRKKQYKSKTVDSILTDKILDIVSKKYDNFYTNNTKCIAQPLLEYLLSNKVFAQQLSSQILELYNDDIPSYLRTKVAEELVDFLEDSVQTNIVHNSAQALQNITTSIVTKASAIPIVTTLSHVLVGHMSILLKVGLAKILATTAAKTFLASVLKKVIIAKIFGFFVTIASLSGGYVVLIVAPFIAAYITYEAYELPEKMGKKVSQAVKESLSGEFKKMNTDIATQIVKEFSNSAINAFAMDVAKDESIKEMLMRFVVEKRNIQ